MITLKDQLFVTPVAYEFPRRNELRELRGSRNISWLVGHCMTKTTQLKYKQNHSSYIILLSSTVDPKNQATIIMSIQI